MSAQQVLRASGAPLTAPPLPEGFDPASFDGVEVKPGVFVLGSVSWNERHGCWCALANVCGALCVIEVSVSVTAGGAQ